MAEVRTHYDDHLGPIYEWYTGPFEEACGPSRALFEELDLAPLASGVAVDFGSGHGLQSLPLAQRGFEVVAVDTCAELLRSLEARRGTLAIRTVEADIAQSWEQIPERFDVAVCMGDTLTHLGSREAVAELIDRTARRLSPGGVFVTTFRDYVSAPLEGEARFIPVRSDADRLLTCFLEYTDERVRVHDIVHERGDAGWQLRVSCYEKLRLDPLGIAEVFRESGLEVVIDRIERGMVTLAGRAKEPNRT